MITVSVPEPIQILNLESGEPMAIDGSTEPWPMHKYLVMWVLPDPALGSGFMADNMRVQILKAFRDTVTGEVSCDDEWVKRMHQAVMTPAAQIPGWAGMNLLPFQKAIVDAWEKRDS